MTSRPRILYAVASLALANLMVWGLTAAPAVASQPEAEITKQCWYTTHAMGCSDWIQQGCSNVTECKPHQT